MFFYILIGLIVLVSLGIGLWDGINAKKDTSKSAIVEFISSFFAGTLLSTFCATILFLLCLVFVSSAPGEFKSDSSVSYKLTDKPSLSNKTLSFHYLDGAGTVQEYRGGINQFTIEDFDGKIITIETGWVTVPGFAPFPLRTEEYATLK